MELGLLVFTFYIDSLVLFRLFILQVLNAASGAVGAKEVMTSRTIWAGKWVFETATLAAHPLNNRVIVSFR